MSLQKARILIDQDRHEDAVAELLAFLDQAPDDPLALTLLALCRLELEEYNDAGAAVDQALAANPAFDYAHSVRARILSERGYPEKALASVDRALELAPATPGYHGQRSLLLSSLKKWEQALQSALSGLELNPDDPICLHARARALTGLGRVGEAADELRQELAENPEDPMIHANLGWLALEKNKPQEALDHFQQALMAEPEFTWARAGLMEALRSRYFFYRAVLGYFLWMAKFAERSQWAIVVGIYFGIRGLRYLGSEYPVIQPVLTPLLIVCAVFVYLTWTGPTVTNLLLRTSRYGKHLLSEEEIRHTNKAGALWAAAALCFLGHALIGYSLWLPGLVLLYLAVLVCSSFHTDKGWPRVTLNRLTLIMAFLGLGGYLALLLGIRGGEYLLGTFGVAALFVLLGANYLVSVKVKR